MKKKLNKQTEEVKKPPLRYSDEKLKEFKEIILQKKVEAENNLKIFKQNLGNENGTDDTSPTFKPEIAGATVHEKEKNNTLETKQLKLIEDYKNALIRIENKTYGICAITGAFIPEARLKNTPQATRAVEAECSKTFSNKSVH
jgi:RNA polymerase-binding transcription factor DksA